MRRITAVCPPRGSRRFENYTCVIALPPGGDSLAHTYEFGGAVDACTPGDAMAQADESQPGSWLTARGPGGTSEGISEPVARRVWIASGGRCAFCNKNLLYDEVTRVVAK
jgi:hypothetical protein